jgi:tetratricopeptide (TPR) repeat protein
MLQSNEVQQAREYHQLAYFLDDWEKSKEAENYYVRALRGKEKALGAEHTSTLDTVNNLGILYKSQGKLAEVEEMYVRALCGYEKAWGAEHTLTLDTVNNLGILYKDQGKLAEAEAMYVRALRGKEKAWGAEHTSTLDTVNNLGNLYMDQGKLVEAEEMYVRALCGYEKASGAEHTSTLDGIHNVGNLYFNSGEMAQAEEMYVRALRGQEKALGSGHADTLRTARNLLFLHKMQAFIHSTHVNARRLRVPGAFAIQALVDVLFTLEKLARLFHYCECLLQHEMGTIGRILMWAGYHEHALPAFQSYRSSQAGPVCDGCEKVLVSGDSHFICKSCPDVNLCEPCFQKATSGIDHDDGTFSACTTHDFLEVPSIADAIHGKLLVDNLTADRWVKRLLESTKQSKMTKVY